MSSLLPLRPSQGDKVICFLLREQEFAIPIGVVKETIALRALTRVPLCPAFVAGLINLRGEVVAVLDLNSFFDMPESGQTHPERRRIILLRGTRGHGAACGLLVDELCGVVPLGPEMVHAVPATLPESIAGFLGGVVRQLTDETEDVRGGRLLLFIDTVRLLGCERLREFRRKQREPARQRTPSP